jgi:hypothetical protein
MTHRRRRKSDPIRETVVVETSDGTRLRCSVAAIGRGTEPRWMILDAKGEQFVGPVVTTDRSQEAVRHLIDDWWMDRKHAGSAVSRDSGPPADAHP